MLEAMAVGVCAIVSPVGWVEEVITQGINRILVAVDSSEHLADVLKYLLENPNLMRKLVKNARDAPIAHYDS
jgi:glycosyltransferase involved in cell wall biosynthesis